MTPSQRSAEDVIDTLEFNYFQPSGFDSQQREAIAKALADYAEERYKKGYEKGCAEVDHCNEAREHGFNAGINKGRAEALEEAAKIAEDERWTCAVPQCQHPMPNIFISHEIRALKDK